MKSLTLLLTLGVLGACGSKHAMLKSRPEAAQRVADTTTAKDSKPAQVAQNQTERKIIYTATVRFQAREKNIEETKEKVLTIAREFGGFMLSSHNNSVVIKVPSDKLQETLAALENMSDNFNKNLFARDVTDAYYDTEIRLANAKRLRQRFLKILNNAKSVKDTLEVESELARVTERIERIEGQLKLLKSQVALSKVTVQIYRKYQPPKRKEYKPGPLGWPFYALYRGGEYVAKGVYWLFVWEK